MTVSLSPITLVARKILIDEPTKTGFKKSTMTAFIRKIYAEEFDEYLQNQALVDRMGIEIATRQKAGEVIAVGDFEEMEEVSRTDREVIFAYIECLEGLVGDDGEKIEFTPGLLDVIAGIAYIARPLAEACRDVQHDSPIKNGSAKN